MRALLRLPPRAAALPRAKLVGYQWLCTVGDPASATAAAASSARAAEVASAEAAEQAVEGWQQAQLYWVGLV